MSLLEVRGLCKSFPVRRDPLGRVCEEFHAVKDVSFAVEAGTTFAIVGESGAGKSTTARLVLRLIEPSSGTISFDGIDIHTLSSKNLRLLRHRMQMIFQDPTSSLDPRITVGDSIAEPIVVFDRNATTKQQRIRRISELLERVGLSPSDRHKYPAQMSGGQLQRIAIARALTLNPDLLVCDEPVAALDMSVRAQVLNLMKDLQGEFKLAFLFISHDLSLVRAIADQVAVMRYGVIVEQGNTKQIFEAPSTEYTKNLLAAVPMITSAVHGTRTSEPPTELREQIAGL